jgi:hypothetical protein
MVAWAAGVCAIDGTTLTVPDGPQMLPRFRKQAGNHGGASYPQLRLLALVACGTRTLIDAVFGPTTTSASDNSPFNTANTTWICSSTTPAVTASAVCSPSHPSRPLNSTPCRKV